MIGFLSKLLGTVGTGGIWVYLAIGLAVYGAGLGSGSWVRGKYDSTIIAKGVADLAVSKSETEAQKTALEKYHAQVEADRANDNAKAAQQAAQQATDLANVMQQLKEAENGRRTAAQQRDTLLHAVPQSGPLGPAKLSPGARAWYDSLYNEQAARGTNRPATP